MTNDRPEKTLSKQSTQRPPGTNKVPKSTHRIKHKHKVRHKKIQQEQVKERKTYMRLLGGILRPSLNQVTCGWGKLRMRGAGTTAPSPWETDCVRSPSSKLPITAGNQTNNTHKNGKTCERVKKEKGYVKSQAQISLYFLNLTFGAHRASAICFPIWNATSSGFDGQHCVVAMVSTVHQERLEGTEM